ncbi:MAG: hypothetical protein ACYC77_07940 [Coriobacteriia bacterium]
MPLVRRDGSRWRLVPALGWAATWGVGAALGVALGGYLTLTGGAGTPGAAALDPTTDLLLLPSVAFVAVLAVHVAGSAVSGVFRGRRAASDGGGSEDEGERPENDRVGR